MCPMSISPAMGIISPVGPRTFSRLMSSSFPRYCTSAWMFTCQLRFSSVMSLTYSEPR
jgi:hypothetical protein